MVLAAGVATIGIAHVGHVEDRRQIQAGGLPVVDGMVDVEHLGTADGLGHRSESQLGEDFPDFFGDVLEEVHDELGSAGELFSQLRVLSSDSHRACVEVANPHHHAARDHEGRRGEPKLVPTQ